MGPRGHGKGSTGWLPCEPAFQKSKARVEGFSGQDLEPGSPSPHLGQAPRLGARPRRPLSLRGGRAHGRRGRRGPAAGRGGRARAEEAAEPGGLAAAVAPPTRVRPVPRPLPRVPPASVSGLGRARGAGQGVGPSPEAVGARAFPRRRRGRPLEAEVSATGLRPLRCTGVRACAYRGPGL